MQSTPRKIQSYFYLMISIGLGFSASSVMGSEIQNAVPLDTGSVALSSSAFSVPTARMSDPHDEGDSTPGSSLVLFPLIEKSERGGELERTSCIKLAALDLPKDEEKDEKYVTIDLKTPDDLYVPLPPSLSQPVCTKMFLNSFRLDLLSGIAIKLKDIAKQTTFRELSILQCSSIKFNLLFPTIRELFVSKKIYRLIYTADAAGVQTPAAALRGAEELLRSSTARGVSIPKGTPGREGYMIEAADIRDFLCKTERKLKQVEDTRLFDECGDEIRRFGLTATSAFVRLPDEVGPFCESLGTLSDSDAIHIISFADSSLDDLTFEKITDHLLEFSNLNILDLSATPITRDSYPALMRILEKESIAFVNLTMTELIEKLFEEDGIVQYLEGNVDLVKKLIWLPLEERDLTPQIERLEEKYRNAMKEAHGTFRKISRVITYFEERQETQKITRKILDEAS